MPIASRRSTEARKRYERRRLRVAVDAVDRVGADLVRLLADLPHAELLEDADRDRVVVVDRGDDALESEPLEAVRDDGASGS